MGDKEKAKECFDLALTIYVQKIGPNHDNVRRIQTKLARLQQIRERDQRS